MACIHSNEEMKDQLTGSDSVAINYFKGDGSMDTVMAIKIINDKQKIDQLATFISGRSVKGNFKCGYDGSLHFFKMNRVVKDINFRMNSVECMYFYFLQNGKSEATALSQPAKEWIISMRKK